MAAFEEGLQRASERTARERKALAGDRREQRRGPRGRRRERLEEIQAVERGREAGRGRADHGHLRTRTRSEVTATPCGLRGLLERLRDRGEQ